MRKLRRRSFYIGVYVVAVTCTAAVAYAQPTSLKQLTHLKGFKTGFEISPKNMREAAFISTLKSEASVGTTTAYWYLPDGLGLDRGPLVSSLKTNAPVGKYSFNRPNSVVNFCFRNGIEIHGHTLLWAQDRFTPPWVLNLPASKSKATLENHISRVVGEYRGHVHTWHVVNEVFDYTGEVVDSYWSRNLGVSGTQTITPAFVDVAFRAAAIADPQAKLIYNDYGQEELDARKFIAIRDMLVDMRLRGIPIHGMGWQVHQNVSTVLDPAFPLEARMNAMAALGFDNYITEMDIVMDERRLDGSLEVPKLEYSDEDLLRQKWAYKKVYEIFSRVNRRVSVQTWGVSDKQSWLGADREPLLFAPDFTKKLAYYGVQEALQGEVSGVRSLQSVWDDQYLTNGTVRRLKSPVALVQPSDSTMVPLWQITASDSDGSYRLKSVQNNRFLLASDNRVLPAASTGNFSEEDESQHWELIPMGANYYLLLNRKNGLSMQQNFNPQSPHPVVLGTCSTWQYGVWKIE